MADEGRNVGGRPVSYSNVRVRPFRAPRPGGCSINVTSHLHGRRVLVTGGSGTDRRSPGGPPARRWSRRSYGSSVGTRPSSSTSANRHRGHERALPHRRHPRPGPDASRMRGHRRRVPLRCAQACRVGRVQPVRGDPDEHRSGRRTSSTPAWRTGVATMILTSSDKAANPTSVMGASKLARREARDRGHQLPRLPSRRRSRASGSATSSGRAARPSSCSPARSRPAARSRSRTRR